MGLLKCTWKPTNVDVLDFHIVSSSIRQYLSNKLKLELFNASVSNLVKSPL